MQGFVRDFSNEYSKEMAAKRVKAPSAAPTDDNDTRGDEVAFLRAENAKFQAAYEELRAAFAAKCEENEELRGAREASAATEQQLIDRGAWCSLHAVGPFGDLPLSRRGRGRRSASSTARRWPRRPCAPPPDARETSGRTAPKAGD